MRTELSIEAKQQVATAMLSVWAYGQGAFGETWIFKYGTVKEPTFKVWCRRLQVYRPDLLVRAAERVLTSWTLPRPPTLGEMAENVRILCGQWKNSEPQRLALPHKRPEGEAHSATANEELDKIYEMLGAKRPTESELLKRRKEK